MNEILYAYINQKRAKEETMIKDAVMARLVALFFMAFFLHSQAKTPAFLKHYSIPSYSKPLESKSTNMSEPHPSLLTVFFQAS